MFTTLLRELKRGILSENPVFVMTMGLCPALAVSTTMQSALAMGLATAFVLAGSNVVISIIRNAVPHKIQIPIFIMVIAFFVTLVQLYMSAYFPELNHQLGIFIPLIVVNCMILGRAQAFAAKNNMFYSFLDGVCAGLGFIAALLFLSVIREFLGANKLWGLTVIPKFQPITMMQLAPGGFFAFALILAVRNAFMNRKKTRKP